MNIKLIVDQAIIRAGKKIDMVIAKRYINEATEILAIMYDTACAVQKELYEVGAELVAVLPDGILKIADVTKDNLPCPYYTYEEGKLHFDKQGSYEVTTLRKSLPAGAETDTLEINENYCMSIAKYIASRVLLDEDPVDAKGIGLLNDFQNESKKTNFRLSCLMRKSKKTNAPLWR